MGSRGSKRSGGLRVLSLEDFTQRARIGGRAGAFLPPRLRRVVSHRIIQNAIALYGVQFATFVVPLVTLPYVTRILSRSEYGLVVFSQSASFLIGIFIDFGFESSMPRIAAGARHDRARLSELVAEVLGARLLLVALTMVVAGTGYMVVPKLHDHPLYLLLAWVAAVAQGFSPSWFFLGIEKLRLVSFIQLGSRVLSAALTFVLVHHRGDGWIVLVLFAGGAVGGSVGSTMLAYRHVAVRRPRLSTSLAALRSTYTLFLGITVLSLYSTANVFILGLLSSSREVAFYGAADRLVRALGQLVSPLPYVAIPRIAYLLSENKRDRALKLARLVLAGLATAGVLMSGVTFLLGPLVVRIIFGQGFHATDSILRVLGLIFIPVCVSAPLRGGWLILLHKDRLIVRIAFVASVVNIGLAVVLVPVLGGVGMSCAALAAETTVLVICVATVVSVDRQSGQPGLLWSGSARTRPSTLDENPAVAGQPLRENALDDASERR